MVLARIFSRKQLVKIDMYILNKDLLDWIAENGPDGPIIVVSLWKGHEYHNCLVHEA